MPKKPAAGHDRLISKHPFLWLLATPSEDRAFQLTPNILPHRGRDVAPVGVAVPHIFPPTGDSQRGTYTVADVAQRLNLKAADKGTSRGPDPRTGEGTDRFCLYPEGNASIRGGEKFTPREVAQLAGISPEQYVPCAESKSSQYQTLSNAFPTHTVGKQPSNTRFDWSAATIYDYRDGHGQLISQVGRMGNGATKQIRQRRPHPELPGVWIYGLTRGFYERKNGHFYKCKDSANPPAHAVEFPDVARALYRVDEVRAARVVIVCEGEKAVEVVRRELKKAGLLGEYAATCNIQGAGKDHVLYEQECVGKVVYAFPDNDRPGREHATQIASRVASVALETRIVELPGQSEKDGVDDFLTRGHSISDLLKIASSSPKWPLGALPEATDNETPVPLFPRLKLREIFQRPNLEDLVEDFLRTCTTSVFGSEYGGYKSFIVLDIGLCIATGKTWQGRRVKQGRVVYIVGEGAYETKARVMAWMQVHGITEIPDDFEIIEIPVQIAGQYQQLIAELREFDPSLIIIDTLAQCNIGRDENDTAAMSELTHAVRMMSRELNAHVALVHHTGKNGLLRGNTSLPANLDTIIMLKKQSGRVVEIECDRTKGSPFEKFSLVGHIIELPERNEYGHNITSLVFERTDAPAPITQLSKTEQARESVFEALKDAPNGMTASDWQKKSGLSSSRFHDYRSELVNAGRVTLNGRIYTATPITPIYSEISKSEPLLYSDYSDDPLGSEQSEQMAGVDRVGTKKGLGRRCKNNPDGEPYVAHADEGDVL